MKLVSFTEDNWLVEPDDVYVTQLEGKDVILVFSTWLFVLLLSMLERDNYFKGVIVGQHDHF
jgi:hypothetical protein